MTRKDLQDKVQLILAAVYRANIAATQAANPREAVLEELADADDLVGDLIDSIETEGVTTA